MTSISMEQIDYADWWEEYFRSMGISTFDGFFQLHGGRMVDRNERRDVRRVVLGHGNNQRALFVKRFHHPHLKDIVGGVCRFRKVISQARVEWENAHYLLANHIDTYLPVCIGERFRIGIETASFLITQELESVCLIDFVLDRWSMLSRAQQENVIVAMAKFVQRLHGLGVSFPDLYIWHLFIRSDPVTGEYHFSIIDLHRMTHRVQNVSRSAKDLGRLYWSMSDDYFDDQHRTLMVCRYLEAVRNCGTMTLLPSAKTFLKLVRRRAATLKKRRKVARNYRHTGTYAQSSGGRVYDPNCEVA